MLREKGSRAIGTPYYFQIFVKSLSEEGGNSNTNDSGESETSGQGSDNTGRSGDDGRSDISGGDSSTGSGNNTEGTNDTDGGNSGTEKETDDETDSEIVVVPPLNVKRNGTVITSDVVKFQEDNEWIILEMYTTDLIGRT